MSKFSLRFINNWVLLLLLNFVPNTCTHHHLNLTLSIVNNFQFSKFRISFRKRKLLLQLWILFSLNWNLIFANLNTWRSNPLLNLFISNQFINQSMMTTWRNSLFLLMFINMSSMTKLTVEHIFGIGIVSLHIMNFLFSFQMTLW